MSDLIFSCSTDNPKFLAQALQAIAWKEEEDQLCSASVSNDGILILTEDTSTIQASVLLRSGLFQNYALVREENFEFRMNLTKFINCIKLFAETATELEIRSRSDAEIQIEITDGTSTTNCILRTLYYPAAQVNSMTLSKAFSAPDSVEVASFMIRSSIVKEMFILPEASMKNTVPVKMVIDAVARLFEVQMEGPFGTVRSTMDFGLLMAQRPKFDLCEPLEASYPISSLLPVLKAMDLSSDTSFKFKGNGMLSIQQAISNQTVGDVGTVVEFILQPLEDNNL